MDAALLEDLGGLKTLGHVLVEESQSGHPAKRSVSTRKEGRRRGHIQLHYPLRPQAWLEGSLPAAGKGMRLILQVGHDDSMQLLVAIARLGTLHALRDVAAGLLHHVVWTLHRSSAGPKTPFECSDGLTHGAVREEGSGEAVPEENQRWWAKASRAA